MLQLLIKVQTKLHHFKMLVKETCHLLRSTKKIITFHSLYKINNSIKTLLSNWVPHNHLISNKIFKSSIKIIRLKTNIFNYPLLWVEEIWIRLIKSKNRVTTNCKNKNMKKFSSSSSSNNSTSFYNSNK